MSTGGWRGCSVAEFLAGHPKVAWVSYAGLPDSKYRALAQKYLQVRCVPGCGFTSGIRMLSGSPTYGICLGRCGARRVNMSWLGAGRRGLGVYVRGQGRVRGRNQGRGACSADLASRQSRCASCHLLLLYGMESHQSHAGVPSAPDRVSHPIAHTSKHGKWVPPDSFAWQPQHAVTKTFSLTAPRIYTLQNSPSTIHPGGAMPIVNDVALCHFRESR